jgi:hypothetical protein
MPLQNRVLPTGEIVAIPDRGTLTGNRGIIHRADQTLGTPRWSHHAWICCTLDWQGRKRQVMTGRNWTELFFLDEAVALAAGHRPCGYCRREAYASFLTAWTTHADTRPKAPEMDKVLHAARIIPGTRTQRRHRAEVDTLPTGAMILHGGSAHLVLGDQLLCYGPDGYGPAVSRPRSGEVEVLTPAPILSVLQNGYQPQLHQSTTRLRG